MKFFNDKNRWFLFLGIFFVATLGGFVVFYETQAWSGPASGTCFYGQGSCGSSLDADPGNYISRAYVNVSNTGSSVSGGGAGFLASINGTLCVTGGGSPNCVNFQANPTANASVGGGPGYTNTFVSFDMNTLTCCTSNWNHSLDQAVAVCTDTSADNYNQPLPCTYTRCTDPAAINNGGLLPCRYVTCGNGVIEQGEVCEGSNFNGATCNNFGFSAGNLNCVNNCKTISTSGCGRYKCVGGTSCSFVSGDTGPNQCAPPTDNVCATLPPSPQVTLYCNGFTSSCTIPSGSSATISWNATNANSCSVPSTGWSGTSGSYSTGPLTSNTTYTVNCTGSGGNAASSVTVVMGAALPPPAGDLTCDLSQ